MSDWRTRFYPYGAEDGLTGEPIPADRMGSEYHDADTKIWWPCLGIITKVYYSNEPGNLSRIVKAALSHEYSSEIQSNDALKTLLDSTQDKGVRLECDVRLIKGLSSTDRVQLEGVPIVQSFGGIDNYGIVSPSDITNTSDVSKIYKSDGDFCVVHFIGGDYTEPVVTNIYPHPYNTIDPPSVEDGRVAFFKFNGVEFLVDREGNILLDATKAGDVRTIDPNTGATKIIKANREVADPEIESPIGMITIQNNSDIVVSAGDDVEQGDLTLQSRTTARLRARSGSVDTFTDQNEQLVRVQHPHGPLRSAAREGDRIKITSGDDNNLFSWLNSLNTTLSSVADSLSLAEDPNVLAAGITLKSFTEAFTVPTYAEGQIIEGSPFCKIAGNLSSPDIFNGPGGAAQTSSSSDNFNFLPEDINEILASCSISSLTDFIGKYVNFNTEKLIRPIVTGSAAAITALKVSGNIPAAEALEIGTKKAIKIILSGGSIDSVIAELAQQLESEYVELQQAIANGDPNAIAVAKQKIETTSQQLQLKTGALEFTDPKAKWVAAALSEYPFDLLNAETDGALQQALEVCINADLPDGGDE